LSLFKALRVNFNPFTKKTYASGLKFSLGRPFCCKKWQIHPIKAKIIVIFNPGSRFLAAKGLKFQIIYFFWPVLVKNLFLCILPQAYSEKNTRKTVAKRTHERRLRKEHMKDGYEKNTRKKNRLFLKAVPGGTLL